MISDNEIAMILVLLDANPNASSNTVLDRAIRFADACSIIPLENLLKVKFPSDSQTSSFAKNVYLTITSCFGNMEASIDDIIIVLFNALGFNDGDLITVSRN
ncbi:unnamed protein product [Rotaria magnacalcarata]